MNDLRIHCGDALTVLRTIPDESVHCCVTSPPYWGLRDYGVQGQLGLERTPEEYVAKIVEVFREVRRVLRADGTCWINLGDSYSRAPEKGGSGPGNKGNCDNGLDEARHILSERRGSSDGKVGRGDRAATRNGAGNLKPKDLVGIPWMAAFALRADGWYLRSDIIWHKPNPMPESVTDRCTKAHEYLFLFSKSERYYWDAETMQEPATDRDPSNRNHKHAAAYDPSISQEHRIAANLTKIGPRMTRNRRDVWTIPTHSYHGAHFATFPPDLIKPCILAGCPQKVCSVCGFVLDTTQENGSIGTNGNDLRSLRKSLPKATIEKASQQVLQQELHGFGEADTQRNRALQMVSETSGTGSQGPTKAVLQQGLCVPFHSQTSEHNERSLHDNQGLRDAVSAGSPGFNGRRIPDGTPLCDGANIGTEIAPNRDRPPQERAEGGQSAGEFGIDDKESPRPSTKKKARKNQLPSLQRLDTPHSTCPHCQADLTLPNAIQPGVVLDPFGGSGTTGMVALELGRNAILIELNPDYCDLIRQRTDITHGLPLA